MFKNKKVLLGILLFIIVIVAIAYYGKNLAEQKQCSENPSLAQCLIVSDTPQYKEITSYDTNTGGYECSKPIKAASTTINKFTGEAYHFTPVDQDEANLFCHTTFVIEYKGKLTVLQKPEVISLINKYPYKDVSIKALEFKYIEDKEFVHRLLPTYKDREIGCIILLETPNEKKVYLENEQLETFEELDYQEFESYLENISEEDRQLFLVNLN